MFIGWWINARSRFKKKYNWIKWYCWCWVPIACGYSLGQSFKTRNSVTVVFFGDGAINQGVVMESMNMAAIYNLPILFVCENNFYAYSTKSADVTKTSIYERAKGFGIDSFKINGMNFKESLTKSKKAINNVRNYKKPVFLEFETYRFQRHFSNEQPKKMITLIIS